MDLMKYKKYEPIYVIGHMNIDLDSAVSSKILSSIFNSLGIESYYAILDNNYEFNEYNKKMLDDCMDFKPKIINLKDVNKYNWFLVDHNDKSHSVGNNCNVIGCIDHHPDSHQVENITISDDCSLALFLYDEFKSIYNFSKEEKYQIFLAFLSDSTFGKSSRYTKKDEEIVSSLGFNYDYEELFKKYFIPTDLSNGIESVIHNGFKKYNFNDVYFESNYIEEYGIDGLEEYKEFIKRQDAFLGRWVDYQNNKTYVYFKYDNKFNEKIYDFIASRATTILNDVLKYLSERNYLKGDENE